MYKVLRDKAKNVLSLIFYPVTSSNPVFYTSPMNNINNGGHMGTKMLTTKQAAEYLGLAETTLEAWRCRGGGPVFIKLNKAVRYSLDHLDSFLNSRTRTSTSEVTK